MLARPRWSWLMLPAVMVAIAASCDPSFSRGSIEGVAGSQVIVDATYVESGDDNQQRFVVVETEIVGNGGAMVRGGELTLQPSTGFTVYDFHRGLDYRPGGRYLLFVSDIEGMIGPLLRFAFEVDNDRPAPGHDEPASFIDGEGRPLEVVLDCLITELGVESRAATLRQLGRDTEPTAGTRAIVPAGSWLSLETYDPGELS